jgi:tetratricopeptide (TPR) repeat protein
MSSSALARLTSAAGALEQDGVALRLHGAVVALEAGDLTSAEQTAMTVVQGDHDNSTAWKIVGVARERAGDFMTALQCYEQVVRIGGPMAGEIHADLGRVAFHSGLFTEAEALYRTHLAKYPDDINTANNLATTLRDQMRYDDAIAELSDLLKRHPEAALLWNTLGTLLVAQFDADRARIFFDEAIRLDPAFGKAIYNRGNLRLMTGDTDAAIADLRHALALADGPTDRAMMQLALAQALLAGGRLAEGWEAYEARRDPHFAQAPVFIVDVPEWTPGDPLAGRRLIVFGEQGLGDEILFASLIPDLVAAIGPEGRLFIAVEPRLVPLFQRSFPDAIVGGHVTGQSGHSVLRSADLLEAHRGQIDGWLPLGALLRQFRGSLEDFAATKAFLVPASERVAYWTDVLSGLGSGPKVGVLWKSLRIDPARSRHFSPFEQWGPVLTLPGVVFVNLQYGDSAAEQAEAARLGIRLWTPPGIDLKDDLDDLAALTRALDLVVGPANATTNIAAACGVPVTLISMPGAWTQLGTDRWPFYPGLQVIKAERLGQWEGAMQALAAHVVQRFDMAGTVPAA